MSQWDGMNTITPANISRLGLNSIPLFLLIARILNKLSQTYHSKSQSLKIYSADRACEIYLDTSHAASHAMKREDHGYYSQGGALMIIKRCIKIILRHFGITAENEGTKPSQERSTKLALVLALIYLVLMRYKVNGGKKPSERKGQERCRKLYVCVCVGATLSIYS